MNSPVPPPVPTPWRTRWRALRTNVFPGLVFVGCVLGIIGLWRESAATPSLVAEAEAPRRAIASPHAGRLSVLRCRLLQSVRAGEILGSVAVAPPELVEASLAVIRAEIDLLQRNLAPAIDQQRTGLEFARLQLEWLRERVALASLRTRAQHAEAELRRAAALHEKDLVSEEAYEAARALSRRLAAASEEQTTLVEKLAAAAQQPGLPATPLADTLAAGLHVQEEKLRVAELQLRPVALVAPIDGVVVALARQEGETVAAGQTILTLVAPQPARLVGFLRPPLPPTPHRDFAVEIRTRSLPRQIATATVTEIGVALEPVPPPHLGMLTRSDLPEFGLRVHLSLPPQLRLLPGELVDVTFAEARRPEEARSLR